MSLSSAPLLYPVHASAGTLPNQKSISDAPPPHIPFLRYLFQGVEVRGRTGKGKGVMLIGCYQTHSLLVVSAHLVTLLGYWCPPGVWGRGRQASRFWLFLRYGSIGVLSPSDLGNLDKLLQTTQSPVLVVYSVVWFSCSWETALKR